MNVTFIGAGSLGCALGGTLAAGGVNVQMVDTWEENVHILNTRGLLLQEGGCEKIARVKAATDCTELDVADLVIILVKSFDTRVAALSARPIVGPHTTVLSLQNGLGHEEILAEILGAERVIAGKTYAGGQLLGPGVVKSGVVEKETVIGELNGTQSERVLRIADVFSNAGLSTLASSRVKGVMWDKLLINVATGALTGVTGLPYGPLHRVPEIQQCALELVSEAINVAHTINIDLSCTDPLAVWTKASAGLPEGFKPSLLLSIEKKQRTEIDFINGAVVRYGERCGVETPANRTLVACVKGIEYGFSNSLNES